jgi:hypothetical protein
MKEIINIWQTFPSDSDPIITPEGEYIGLDDTNRVNETMDRPVFD